MEAWNTRRPSDVTWRRRTRMRRKRSTQLPGDKAASISWRQGCVNLVETRLLLSLENQRTMIEPKRGNDCVGQVCSAE
jgi:hypothetical protein